MKKKKYYLILVKLFIGMKINLYSNNILFYVYTELIYYRM